ncbi:MAG TPA: hypothetical protein VN281_21470 [Verrucomicrobiae bacterium]|nr:hypothetical protein [Verrucomicrobiae bacterium]
MDERKSFLLRMDPRLWRELEAWAQEELRSVNGQIEYLLKLAVQQRKGKGRANESPRQSGEEEAPKVQSPKSKV